MKQQKATIDSHPASTELQQPWDVIDQCISSRTGDQSPNLIIWNNLASLRFETTNVVSRNSRPTITNNNDQSQYYQAITVLGESFQTIHQRSTTHNDAIERYLLGLMAAFQAPSPPRCIGSEIDPFHTLPQISTSSINIERLKKHCK
jgi:hypothetical protein